MKSHGQVESIFIRPQPSKPVIELEKVLALPGKGLQGDYSTNQTPGEKEDPAREVTLIEREALAAVEMEHQVSLNPGESRRNIVTSNISLNKLVGKDFRVGTVTMKGIRLCEPCTHLAELTQKKVIPAMVHRGGLRAEILTEGTIQIGDPIFSSEDVSTGEVALEEPKIRS